MNQNTSCHTHHVSGQASTSGAFDVEYSRQCAEDRFNTVTDMSQSLLYFFRPPHFLVILPQRQKQDAAFTPKAVFPFGIVVDLVADQHQVAAIQHQLVQNLRVGDRCRRQDPFVNQLVNRYRSMLRCAVGEAAGIQTGSGRWVAIGNLARLAKYECFQTTSPLVWPYHLPSTCVLLNEAASRISEEIGNVYRFSGNKRR